MRLLLVAGVAALAAATVGPVTLAWAADAPHGKMVFQEQCGLCHTAGAVGEAGLGPDLTGVVGRKAGAGDATFSYTDALAKSGITWAPDSLDKFLSDPQAMVPGTAMPISLADPKDRADVVSFLASAKK
jgi:cytochrome c2